LEEQQFSGSCKSNDKALPLDPALDAHLAKAFFFEQKKNQDEAIKHMEVP